MSTQIKSTPVKGILPQDLVDKGWGLFLTDSMRFRARNEAREAELGPFPSADEAITEAHSIQAEFDEADAIAAEQTAESAAATRDKRPTVTTLLALKTIRTDGGTQPREALDMLVVADYKEAMLAEAAFPAVDVFLDVDSGDHWLADGFHRHRAAQEAGLTELLANVHEGTQRDALLFSLGANATHGLPRSNADKRRAVTILLKDDEWTKLTDSAIAKQAHVSQPFVSSLRTELETQNVISAQPKRKGVDGVVRDTTNIGSRSEEETDDRQTTLPGSAGILPADAGETVPEREFGDSPTDLVQILTRHGGVLMRRQLEEFGFSYATILDALSEGAILQPETGKFTLPDHKPQPGASRQEAAAGGSKSTASGPAAKPKPTLEEIAKGRMLSITFTVIPAMRGKISVSINSSLDKTKALRETVAADDVRGFSPAVMQLIFTHLNATPTTKAGSARRVVKAAKKSGSKKPAPKKPSRKPAPKKKATKKARKR